MSTSGIELLTRSSLNSIQRSSRASSAQLRGSLGSNGADERNWSWKYLRHQFRLKNMEELYERYQQRLHHGYFSVFLLLQLLLCVAHVCALLATSDVRATFLDIIIYTIVTVLCWSLVTIIFKEKIIQNFPWIPLIISCIIVIVFVLSDIGLPLYHTTSVHPSVHFRPAYAVHTLLACYVFLPVTQNLQALVLGTTVTLCHIVALGMLVYVNVTNKYQRLVSDFIYLLSVNGLGLYFRYLNEVSIRRTFLDRRACVETTFKLDYEKQQEEGYCCIDWLYYVEKFLCIGCNPLTLSDLHRTWIRLFQETENNKCLIRENVLAGNVLSGSAVFMYKDHLMVSILPRHVVDDVRKDIRRMFQYLKSNKSVPVLRKPFSEMYVKSHHNVSVLYADVVNYSQLTVSLPPTKLVETLNELFGRFDEASEERRVLRIKFLGDCYYCAAGIPESNPHHAKSCVDLGLDMIAIIKDVREGRRLKHGLDMRIGIHSGNILSGLVGVSKWQYDIWSHDVIIASHMEQTGQPGKVHITRQTLELLGGEYHSKPAYGAHRSTLLQKYSIETFFIIPNDKHNVEENANELRPVFHRRSSMGVRKLTTKSSRRSSPDTMAVSRRRTAFMDNNLHQYQETLKKADLHMEKAIKNMHLGIYDRWKCQEHVDPFCLTFPNLNWEIPFVMQPDPLFKYYVSCSYIVLVAMLLIQGIGMPSSHWIAWGGFGLALGTLTSLLPFTWTHFLWNKYWDPHGDEDNIPEPTNCLMKYLYDMSLKVVTNVVLRTIIYLITSLVLTTCALLELVECKIDFSTGNNSTLNGSGAVTQPAECLPPWHITEACSLAVLMNFFFLRIHFQLKLFLGCLITIVYGYGIWNMHPNVFENGETWNPGMEPKVAHIMSIGFLTLSLHLLDRQSEYMNRLDYRWQRQLAAEHEEAETTRMVNKMLLQNILPIHVAELYLNTDRARDKLYHEEYENVAVMFASLTDCGLDASDGCEANEMGNLELLNQIICDFDKILFGKTMQGRVEKIKMAGWTYMAACGLDPGRRDSVDSAHGEHFSEHVVHVLARFAARMMSTLQRINEEKTRTFHLRIGISHGSVTAGVVGAHKPLYDIWGDAVNMASRMDSTGEPGKIQVTEETAKILQQQGLKCKYRGPTFVKNKNYVTTYFVCLDAHYQLVKLHDTDESFSSKCVISSSTTCRMHDSQHQRQNSVAQGGLDNYLIHEQNCNQI